MIRRLLVANRGEIAVRVARGARELGISPAGIYSEADERAYHLQFMDEAACVGPAPAPESYLNIEAVVAAAKALGADAVHPGYGFLSERAEFAQAVRKAGLTFVGPTPESMAAMGSKIEAKRRVRESGVPVVPGYDGESQSPAHLREEAKRAGFPLLIKASAGGGGRGMRVVDRLEQFDEALEAAKREALAAFGNDAVLLERYLRRPRHIEFQVLGDAHGNLIHLGERECSIQRRHQKVVEEAPSVALSPELRAEMGAAAVRAAKSVDYVNAGTCEFMLDEDGKYYFLEMNTRLQVEHPVTELAYGIDLVHWQTAHRERRALDARARRRPAARMGDRNTRVRRRPGEPHAAVDRHHYRVESAGRARHSRRRRRAARQRGFRLLRSDARETDRVGRGSRRRHRAAHARARRFRDRRNSRERSAAALDCA